jgi:histidine triad (HIT) family protein
MNDCIFCKIVKGDIPSSKVYEDKDILAFLDIAPANKGHALVVTKAHHETMIDMPPDLLKKMAEATQKIARAVVKATQADGFNVFMNNKKQAGQLVPHVHFHIVPRFSNDGISFEWPHQKYAENEIQEYQERIKKFL